MAGYAAKSLAAKLDIGRDMTLLFVDAPAGYKKMRFVRQICG